MKKRVDCADCDNFIPQTYEDEDDIFSKEASKAKCAIGKRVMFRQPKFSRPTSMAAINDYGWIRYCDEFVARVIS